ncbi:coenzyme F420-0:L-glutamate ligase [Aquabacter sp. CN5-332]|uniref:coenzyme F420-0:L-glutamate ligase n=1 Tax=Aquabacter sp. CN5-332 TaxID=3156608 RepID=UPI0032B320EC
MTDASPDELRLIPLRGVPWVMPGDDLADILFAALATSGQTLQVGDVLVLAQKIVSKAEGRLVHLPTVTPSTRAEELAQKTQKDARLVELVLLESAEVLRAVPGVLVVAHRLGMVLANAGIDRSNVDGHDCALLLPVDPDASSGALRREIKARTGLDVAVLIIDSIGRAWRMGTVGTTIGASGLPTLLNLRGTPDLFGRPLETTEIGMADELAAAASLVMGQGAEGRPIVLARGVPYARTEASAKNLIRPRDKDLFR